jgi:hypothetical protein
MTYENILRPDALVLGPVGGSSTHALLRINCRNCMFPIARMWREGLTLTPMADGRIEFTMADAYSGPLAPLITWAIPDLQPAFDTFANDLKRRAECAAP